MHLVPIARLMNDMQNEGKKGPARRKGALVHKQDSSRRKMHMSCEWQKIVTWMDCKALPRYASDFKHE
jgi:hypothetical protein